MPQIAGVWAVWGTCWLQLQWCGLLHQANLAAVWGEAWQGKSVVVLSDNTTVVAAVNSNTSRVTEISHLLCCLAFVTAGWECQMTAAHLLSTQNCMADTISCNKADILHFLLPQALPEPDRIPEELMRLTIIDAPDWSLPKWKELWSTVFHRGWHLPLKRSMQLRSEDTLNSANNSSWFHSRPHNLCYVILLPFSKRRFHTKFNKSILVSGKATLFGERP